MALTQEQRFAKYVKVGPGCWEWTGRHVRFGYGQFNWKGRTNIAAHRAAWILANGPVARHLFVCHHCDNPGCVRPSHLFVGTRADNTSDMVRKGRQARGERSGNAKLSANDVLSMRAQYREGRTMAELAKIYKVAKVTVVRIVDGKRWKHVTNGVSLARPIPYAR